MSATVPLNISAALRKQRRINNHWKPVFLNCAPCSEHYEIIVKLETFEKDVNYIRRRLGLDSMFNSSSSRKGHQSADRRLVDSVVGQQSADRTSEEMAVEVFRSLDRKLVERVYQIYEPDFLLFGYSPHKYFNN